MRNEEKSKQHIASELRHGPVVLSNLITNDDRETNTLLIRS